MLCIYAIMDSEKNDFMGVMVDKEWVLIIIPERKMGDL